MQGIAYQEGRTHPRNLERSHCSRRFSFLAPFAISHRYKPFRKTLTALVGTSCEGNGHGEVAMDTSLVVPSSDGNDSASTLKEQMSPTFITVKKLPKVLMLHTGGTLGMVWRDRVVVTPACRHLDIQPSCESWKWNVIKPRQQGSMRLYLCCVIQFFFCFLSNGLNFR